jgi:uncharacterized damage-inducible protein DinB
MQIVDALRDLFHHMEWADATVWAAVRRLSGRDDKRLRELLQHLHGTQRAFLIAWQEKEFDRGIFAERDLDSIQTWARDYYQELTPFLDAVRSDALDEPVRLPWAERFNKGAHTTSLVETMIQVTAHSTYHRGQVNMRIRELAGEPELVDYIAWVWKGRPPAPWQ